MRIEHDHYHSPATGDDPTCFFIRTPSGKSLPLGVVTYPHEFYRGAERDGVIREHKQALAAMLNEIGVKVDRE